MQSNNSEVLDGDVGFDKLKFEAIYHDSAYPDQDVIRQRCAEVLAKSQFSLVGTLEHIVVRTDADIQTLKYLLDEAKLADYIPKVRKSTGGGVFFDRYTALDYVDTAPNRITFKLRPSSSPGKISTNLELFSADGLNKVLSMDCQLLGAKPYYKEHNLAPGQYLARFTLEGCFAHKSIITIL